MTKISIDENQCMQCGKCALACPYGIFKQADGNVPVVQATDMCVACGHCVALCTEGAISHDAVSADRIKPVGSQNMPSPEQMLSLLQTRRSIRAFTNKPVDKKLIETILAAANAGPSPHNVHRVGYAVVQDRATIGKILGALAEGYGKSIFLLKNPAALETLPAAVRERVLSVRPQLPMMERIAGRIKAGDDILQRGTPSLVVMYGPRAGGDFWGPRIDVTIALQNASLACASLSLGSCELGYIEIAVAGNPQIQVLLGIPEDRMIYGIMAIGHPAYEFGNRIEKEPAKISWQ